MSSPITTQHVKIILLAHNRRTKFSKIKKSNNKTTSVWIANVADIVTFVNVKEYVWINPFGQSGHKKKLLMI